MVNFYLDSIPLHQSVTADSNNEFVTKLRMPYVAEHSYLLVARGAVSGNATARDRITSTRTVDLEFEDMMPPTFKTPGQCYAEDVSYFWEAMWSKQMFVYFEPDTILIGAQVEFQFSVAQSDTFDVIFHGSIGHDQGRYAVLIDGDSIATIDGYVPPGQWDPLPSGPVDVGIHYLAAGAHHIRFVCLGKADSATNYFIEPDCLVLRPTTYMPPTPGTILATVTTPTPPAGIPVTGRSLEIYPNPIQSHAASVSLTLSPNDGAFYGARVSVRVFDVLGRETISVLHGYLANDELRGTLELPTALPGTYFVRILLTAANGGTMILQQQVAVE